MDKLTKEKAIQYSLEQWEILVNEPLTQKYEATARVLHNHDYGKRVWLTHNCFFCEYVKENFSGVLILGDSCNLHCPIDWPGEHCISGISPYPAWENAVMHENPKNLNPEEISELAKSIYSILENNQKTN